MVTLASLPGDKKQKQKVSSLLERFNPAKNNLRILKNQQAKLNNSAVPMPVAADDKQSKRRIKSLAETNKGSFPVLRMNESQKNLRKRKKKVGDEFPYFTPSKSKQ